MQDINKLDNKINILVKKLNQYFIKKYSKDLLCYLNGEIKLDEKDKKFKNKIDIQIQKLVNTIKSITKGDKNELN